MGTNATRWALEEEEDEKACEEDGDATTQYGLAGTCGRSGMRGALAFCGVGTRLKSKHLELSRT